MQEMTIGNIKIAKQSDYLSNRVKVTISVKDADGYLHVDVFEDKLIGNDLSSQLLMVSGVLAEMAEQAVGGAVE
jgi:hypothetical protein